MGLRRPAEKALTQARTFSMFANKLSATYQQVDVSWNARSHAPNHEIKQSKFIEGCPIDGKEHGKRSIGRKHKLLNRVPLPFNPLAFSRSAK
jgi:hypothetical protein